MTKRRGRGDTQRFAKDFFSAFLRVLCVLCVKVHFIRARLHAPGVSWFQIFFNFGPFVVSSMVQPFAFNSSRMASARLKFLAWRAN